MTEYADVPLAVLAELRSVCRRLPEVIEEPAWTGTRWRIRQRTFAHVLTVDSPTGPATVMTFRSSGPELDAGVDWSEVAELLTESYRTLAPKKLAALVDEPTA